MAGFPLVLLRGATLAFARGKAIGRLRIDGARYQKGDVSVCTDGAPPTT